MTCPVCEKFHFPPKEEWDKLCYKHVLQLYCAVQLGILVKNIKEEKK